MTDKLPSSLKQQIRSVSQSFAHTQDTILHQNHAPKPPQLFHAQTHDPLVLPRDLSYVLSVCEQAPFGKGTQTVVDEKVRKVLQTDEIKVEWEYLDEVLKEINERLCPWIRDNNKKNNKNNSGSSNSSGANINNSSDKLRAQFYKLLVYQPGDFFACHRDSKKNSQHIATLVVDLGVERCKGGEVVFADRDPLQCIGGIERRAGYYDPEEEEEGRGLDKEEEKEDVSESKVRWDSGGVPGAWACWFPSLWHAVLPLEQGIRVVATYNIIIDSPSPSSSSSSLSSSASSSSSLPVTVHLRPEEVSSSSSSSSSSQQQIFSHSLNTTKVFLNPLLFSLLTSFLSTSFLTSTFYVLNKQLSLLLPPHFPLVHSLRSLLLHNSSSLRQTGHNRVGFPLRHTYSFEEGETCEAWQLKGRDRVLYDALCNMHCQPNVYAATLFKERTEDSGTVGATLVKSLNVCENDWSFEVSPDNIDNIKTKKQGMLWLSRAFFNYRYTHPKPTPEEQEKLITLPECVRALIGEGVENLKLKQLIAYRSEGPVTEYDGDTQWNGTYFNGVLWCATLKDIKRCFCLNQDKTKSENHMWGNEASFAMLAYHTAVLIVDLFPLEIVDTRICTASLLGSLLNRLPEKKVNSGRKRQKID